MKTKKYPQNPHVSPGIWRLQKRTKRHSPFWWPFLGETSIIRRKKLPPSTLMVGDFWTQEPHWIHWAIPGNPSTHWPMDPSWGRTLSLPSWKLYSSLTTLYFKQPAILQLGRFSFRYVSMEFFHDFWPTHQPLMILIALSPISGEFPSTETPSGCFLSRLMSLWFTQIRWMNWHWHWSFHMFLVLKGIVVPKDYLPAMSCMFRSTTLNQLKNVEGKLNLRVWKELRQWL